MSAVPEAVGPTSPTFRELALSEPVLQALTDVGYESPSPIQAATIPVLLSGVDMLGQAQTGTGKTAAFALPALTKIDLTRHEPQVLVLVPTRELALQVAEAFQRYAAHMKGFHVLPIYGGQSYQPQLNALHAVTIVRSLLNTGRWIGVVRVAFVDAEQGRRRAETTLKETPLAADLVCGVTFRLQVGCGRSHKG